MRCVLFRRVEFVVCFKNLTFTLHFSTVWSIWRISLSSLPFEKAQLPPPAPLLQCFECGLDGTRRVCRQYYIFLLYRWLQKGWDGNASLKLRVVVSTCAATIFYQQSQQAPLNVGGKWITSSVQEDKPQQSRLKLLISLTHTQQPHHGQTMCHCIGDWREYLDYI